MNKHANTAFWKELSIARQAVTQPQVEWSHLERAHIIGQPSWWAHLYTHVLMLGWAIRNRDFREALGQLPRVALAAPSSLIGLAPTGNPGGSKVGIFSKHEIPDDLKFHDR